MTPKQIEYLQLVTNHQAILLGYIRSIAPKVSHEDVLQEANIVLWDKMDKFELGTNFKAFACRVAYLKTMEALHAHKRKSWLVFDSDILDVITEHYSNDEDGQELAQSALRGCLTKLKDRDRELIHQRYTLGNTVRAIAGEMGKKEGALQQAFFRCHNALRTCMQKKLNITT